MSDRPHDWIERIIWDAIWGNDDPDDPVECSWDQALEYEEETSGEVLDDRAGCASSDR